MKVLNLYAGIGGNRKLWPDVGLHVFNCCFRTRQEVLR